MLSKHTTSTIKHGFSSASLTHDVRCTSLYELHPGANKCKVSRHIWKGWGL